MTFKFKVQCSQCPHTDKSKKDSCIFLVDLQSDILVIDPSPESIKIAEGKEGVRGMVADADQFLATQDSKDYNKYLFLSVVHHLPDQKETFESAYQCLPKGGEILIIRRKEQHYFPVWKAVHSKLKSNRNTPETNIDVLTEVGFTVASDEDVQTQTLVKNEYFNQLRFRKFSVLNLFTDEEIEEGLRELDEVVFKGKDSIVFENIMTVIKATKTD